MIDIDDTFALAQRASVAAQRVEGALSFVLAQADAYSALNDRRALAAALDDLDKATAAVRRGVAAANLATVTTRGASLLVEVRNAA